MSIKYDETGIDTAHLERSTSFLSQVEEKQMLFDKGSLTTLTRGGHVAFDSSKIIFIFNNCQYWEHYILMLSLYIFCLVCTFSVSLQQRVYLSYYCVLVFRLVSNAKKPLENTAGLWDL